MQVSYNPHEYEPKWRQKWLDSKIYKTDDVSDKPKFYCLDFFPYPSGSGLSVGHCRNYIPTDVIARYYRMRGYNVLHPMGWDAFGFPAENYAIQMGVHPAETTRKNAATYRRQLQLIGASYDWDREINSTHPDYYKWTQWFFLLLYKRGLAYRKKSEQWWCDRCESVLANEQVINGCCWRHENTPVTKKPLEQWFFKITAYAERLLNDLDELDWPEPIKIMQRNWIGRSTGAQVTFMAKNGVPIEVFTTRPDTLFGATFMVLAPEHPLVPELTTADRRAEVEAYIQKARTESEIDRMSTEKEKTGVFTGAYAINPVNDEKIPIWIADYVLMGYGTGAIMCVPYGDQRDYEFAQKYGIEIRKIIEPENPDAVVEGQAYTGDGTMVNCSEEYNGLPNREFYEKICDWLEAEGRGKRTVNYKMRDWLISRQRYWGAPIPVVLCESCGEQPVPEDQLPVLLPEDVDFTPAGDGKSPLARVESFVNTTCPQCGGHATRETDTMDGFACSSWYFLRFPNPRLDTAPFDRETVEYWLPVDLYVGGAEHAVMHLLYARFWTKVMQDAGLVSFGEPFAALRNQGMLLAEDGGKMSKSKNNVITPDEVAEEYSVDVLRMYLMFLAPFDYEVSWSEASIAGVDRFARRVWRLFDEHWDQFSTQPIPIDFDRLSAEDKAVMRKAHQTIEKVTFDIERMQFNTAIAALMELVNVLTPYKDRHGITDVYRESCRILIHLMAPFAPYMAEEIWHHIGGAYSIHQQAWLGHNPDWAKENTITLVVQVNGKKRDDLTVPADVTKDQALELATSSEKIQKYTTGKRIIKSIYVPRRLVNLVVK
ncbi:MAG: leucine--tRNA ligase [Gemmatimonadetes bacterium]|nr:MAG: leucine--tRNA ligase [Gemmatimonadota bacterium]